MASCLLSQQNMEEARNMLEKSLELWQGKDEELPQVFKGFANLLIVHLLQYAEESVILIFMYIGTQFWNFSSLKPPGNSNQN